MSDCHLEVVKRIEESLVDVVDAQNLYMICNIITKILNDYEISERCTDLVVQDTDNQKLINTYCACLTIDGKSKNTIYQYSNALKSLDLTIHKDFTEMGTYDIRYYLACQSTKVSNRTLENYRSYLSSFFKWMFEEGYISKNPLATIKPIKYIDEVRLPFSDIELDAMRMACKEKRDRAMFELLLSTGIRLNEMSLLDIQDIDFNTLAIHIKYGKGGKERLVYTTALAAKHIKDYLLTRSDNNSALFISRQKQRISKSGNWRAIKNIGKKAQIDDVHPHRFRRTFATNLAKKGMPIQDIQRLLGHSNINTTMVYVYGDNELIKSSYNKYIA